MEISWDAAPINHRPSKLQLLKGVRGIAFREVDSETTRTETHRFQGKQMGVSRKMGVRKIVDGLEIIPKWMIWGYPLVIPILGNLQIVVTGSAEKWSYSLFISVYRCSSGKTNHELQQDTTGSMPNSEI